MMQNYQRNRDMRTRWENGESLRSIGEYYNLSATGVRTAIKKLSRVEREAGESFSGLSARARNTILRLGVTGKDQLRQEIICGRLAPGKVANYGNRSHKEVIEFLGMSPSEDGRNSATISNHIKYLERFGYKVIPPDGNSNGSGLHQH